MTLYNNYKGEYNFNPDMDSKVFKYALENNSNEIIKFLIGNGADVKGVEEYWFWDRISPIFIAASNKNIEIVNLLLDKGASPLDIMPGEINRANYLFYESIT